MGIGGLGVVEWGGKRGMGNGEEGEGEEECEGEMGEREII
jgi:hypothetical protein